MSDDEYITSDNIEDPVTGLKVVSMRRLSRQNSSYERNVVKSRFLGMRKRAQTMGMDFDLDEDWIRGKLALTACEVTGIPFAGSGQEPYALTIDRENNSIGYVKSNCRAVVWIYNNAKSQFTHEELMKMSRALVANDRIIVGEVLKLANICPLEDRALPLFS